MSRIKWLKQEKWRLSVLLVVTASLPFLYGEANPAGCDPFTVFSGLALMGWTGVIGILCLSPEDRRKP